MEFCKMQVQVLHGFVHICNNVVRYLEGIILSCQGLEHICTAHFAGLQ